MFYQKLLCDSMSTNNLIYLLMLKTLDLVLATVKFYNWLPDKYTFTKDFKIIKK